MRQKVNLNDYFERIGFAGSIAPTLATLEAILGLHPAAIPFENLDPLMGRPVLLDQASLEHKLLHKGRGGYCFEHNTLLMNVLRSLDYTVRPLLARGLWSDPDNTRPSHLVLLVEINTQTYLADVGHGGLTLTAPLRLKVEAEQSTPHETFRLMGGDPEWTLEVRIGEDWRKVYAFTTEPVSEAEIATVNQSMATAPTSPMTRELRVALAPGGRRLKLHNTQFTIQPVGGDADKRSIETLERLRETLTGTFGLALPPADILDPVLAKFLPEAPQSPTPKPVTV